MQRSTLCDYGILSKKLLFMILRNFISLLALENYISIFLLINLYLLLPPDVVFLLVILPVNYSLIFIFILLIYESNKFFDVHTTEDM